MMTEAVKEELRKKEPTDFHRRILTHVRGLVNMSREDMGKHYDQWERNLEIYRSQRPLDKEDRVSQDKGKPVKMVVPLTFAQVQSFVAFGFLTLTQNRRFYELTPTGAEDHGTKQEDCELVLERDLRKNKWNGVLYQFLLDAARFNISILESGWTERYQNVAQEQMVPPMSFMGTAISDKGNLETVMTKVLKHQGNYINNVSPFRFFPDTRIPLHRFQEGEFCFHEEDYAVMQLKKMEQDGEVAGIEHIKKLSEESLKERGESKIGANVDRALHKQDEEKCAETAVVVTKGMVDIIPKEFKLEDDVPLGPEEFAVRYIVWYANDCRIIRLEPSTYLHGEFPYDVAQFDSDQESYIGPGLCDVIDKLQEVVTWFINSHIKAVKNVIGNRLVVDPAKVDVASLESDSPFIFLRKNAAALGPSGAVMQLAVSDTTGNHMADADMLTKFTQIVSGINDNAMGQYNSGRRSATEARAVSQGAGSRMKTVLSIIHTMGLEPHGRKLLTNLRQGLSYETFKRIVGASLDDATAQLRYQEFQGTVEELVAGDDFFVFDSTLPSEKGFLAQSLQELLMAAMSNPEVMQLLNLDPRKLIEEISQLRGVTNLKRFSLQPQPMVPGAQPTLPVPQPPALPAPVV